MTIHYKFNAVSGSIVDLYIFCIVMRKRHYVQYSKKNKIEFIENLGLIPDFED